MKLISFMASLCLCATALGQGARASIKNVVTSANNVPPGAQAPLFTLLLRIGGDTALTQR